MPNLNPYEIHLEEVKTQQLAEIDRRANRMKNILTKDTAKKKALDLAMCKDDIHFWMKNYLWIYEPRSELKSVPYLPQKFQVDLIEELINAIKGKYDLRIEKSRDMRATWSIIIVFVYLWQFHQMTFLVGSRKAEEVDKLGDLDTLLPKARFILSKQPKWILPKDFDLDKHAGSMNIVNPETGGSLAGESNNANFGTGGRRNAIFFDEFAKWEGTDSLAWTSAGANTPCRLAVSTPFFKNNRFYQLKNEPIKNIAMHWSQDEVKAVGSYKDENGKLTSPWYEEQKTRYRPDELAQEFDISYSGTQQSSVFFEELAQMRIEQRIRKVDYMQNVQLYWAFDPGIGDIWSNGFYQMLGYAEEIRWIDYYENQNQPIQHYIDWVKDIERPWNKIHLDLPAGGSNYFAGWRDIIVIPDPNQGTNRELSSGKSLVQQLNDAGFKNVKICPIGRLEAISEAKRIFNKLWIDDNNPRMITALDRISSYHYKYNEKMQEYEPEPVHDASSHCADQFKYFSAYLKNPEKIAKEIEQKKDLRDYIITKPNIPPNVGMAGI